MKQSKKLNEGCIKVFNLLKLLHNDNADYESVIEIFRDETNEQTINNIQVNLNKFINTLKIFGIKIKKEKNQFKLLNSINTIKFTLEDLKSISILTEALQNFPDSELTEKANNFLQSVEKRMTNENKNTLNLLNQNSKHDFSFYYSDIREQIQQCEKVCSEKYITSILYTQNGIEKSLRGTPKEVLYDSKTAYLKIYDYKTNRDYEIPISNIFSITRMPQKASGIEMQVSVVFKLKNRLAKTYKLKENEEFKGEDEFGNKIISSKHQVLDNLLHRLLRYTYDCEIISPQYVKDEMNRLINETIKQYEE